MIAIFLVRKILKTIIICEVRGAAMSYTRYRRCARSISRSISSCNDIIEIDRSV